MQGSGVHGLPSVRALQAQGMSLRPGNPRGSRRRLECPMPPKLFDPASPKPFALSRSKVELFLDCPRCFWLDRRLGIARPSGPPFNLNSAVDQLLKNEFDRYRAAQQPHPLMAAAGLNAVPHAHPQLAAWRENFKGVRSVHRTTGFELFGAIDDLWRDLDSGALIVADYKATSKSGEVSLDAAWQISYKRQMEFYQWLLRRQGLEVARRGWFVYANGLRDRPSFDGRLEFSIRMIPYDGDDGWVEGTLAQIRATLMLAEAPPGDCEFCSYAAKASAVGAPARPRSAPRRRPMRSAASAAADAPTTGDLFSDSAPPPAQASPRRGA